jgi:hypothetical protein
MRTGLSLERYEHANVQLHGTDLCAKVLGVARKSVASRPYPFVNELEVTDAHELCHPTRSSTAQSRSSSDGRTR